LHKSIVDALLERLPRDLRTQTGQQIRMAVLGNHDSHSIRTIVDIADSRIETCPATGISAATRWAIEDGANRMAEAFRIEYYRAIDCCEELAQVRTKCGAFDTGPLSREPVGFLGSVTNHDNRGSVRLVKG